MAMNWAILDPQSVKVETPDFVGSINRGMALGRNLGEFAGMQALGRQVAQDAQGTELGSSVGALASYNPEKALTMLENRNVLSDKFGNAERIAQMRRQTGIDSPEKEAIANELSENTNKHAELVSRAIGAARSNATDDVIQGLLSEALALEASDRTIKAKASYAGIPVGSTNMIGVKKSLQYTLDSIGEADIRKRLAAAQEAMIPIEQKKAEAQTLQAQAGAKTAEVELSQAPNKIIGEVVSGFNATDDGKSFGKVSTAIKLLESAYENAKNGNTSAMQTILVMANKADDPDSAVLLGEATARGDLSISGQALNQAKSVFGNDIRTASMGPAYKQAKDSFTIRYTAGLEKLKDSIELAQKRIDAAKLNYNVSPADFFQAKSVSFKANEGGEPKTEPKTEPSGGTEPIRVKSVAEADALPVGTVFIDPKGNRRTR